MPNFHRAYLPGGSFFFTAVTDGRAPFLCTLQARNLLRGLFRECLERWPFAVDAIVLLPDHLHTVWTLPAGDSAYSKRLGWMKKEFTKAWLQQGGSERVTSGGRQRYGRRGVLQPKFWEHVIRDDNDLARHFDYIHYNPVKHGLVPCPHAWPWSSFHRPR